MEPCGPYTSGCEGTSEESGYLREKMGEGQEKKEQKARRGCVCKIVRNRCSGKGKRRKLKRSGFWEK